MLLASHRACAFIDADGVRHEACELEGSAVDLVSAVGNPDAFENTVKELGASVVSHWRFRDHHAFEKGELAGLGERPLLVTAKDAVKLEGLGVPFGVLEVELEIVRGASVLAALLDALPVSESIRARRALHEGLHG